MNPLRVTSSRNCLKTMKLKPGNFAYLQRGKRRYLVRIISDHTDTYPAVTVERNGEAWIIGINELVTTEQIEQENKEKLMQAKAKVQIVVDAFNSGFRTSGAIAKAIGIKQVKILGLCLQAERMGLIKLERKRYHRENKIRQSDQDKPVSLLSKVGLVSGGGPAGPLHENPKPAPIPDEGRADGLAPSSGESSQGNGQTSSPGGSSPTP